MLMLTLGILVFIGIHLVPAAAPELRDQLGKRLGNAGWRAIHGLVAILGLYLIASGYAAARMEPVFIWYPPSFLSHLTALLMLVAFIFVAAAWVPKNAIKAKVGHPMLIGVKTWAIAHLLVNGTLADFLLFGSFLAWAVASYIMHRRADRAAGVSGAGETKIASTLITLVLGIVLTAVFAMWLHPVLIGVSAIIRA
ncbi:MAG TPA: NnrU family protein [Marinobacterium sp.]|nr:NnrU family protein [Marinobacterium sp.]